MITHLNNKNKPKMVNVGQKKITKRNAIAQGIIIFSEKIFKKIEKMSTKKGEIISIAIIAGIMGAKKTSELIPLCHNIGIDNIDINIKTNKKTHSLTIIAKVQSTGKTGAEMEALTAVSLSCLTIYDMCKNLDKNILINQIMAVNQI